MIVIVWVDHVLIACDKKSEEKRLREALEGSFKMKYLGDAKVILGIRITLESLQSKTHDIHRSKALY